MRLRVLAAIISMSVVGVASADDAHTSTKRLTNIPAQGLAPALQALARQWSLQIVYVSEEIGERHTQGAVGEFDPEQALDRLLEGTDLTFKFLDDKDNYYRARGVGRFPLSDRREGRVPGDRGPPTVEYCTGSATRSRDYASQDATGNHRSSAASAGTPPVSFRNGDHCRRQFLSIAGALA